MNRWAIGIGAVALIAAAVWAVTSNTQGGSDVEYRYATVATGEIVRSTSANGTLVPLTRVDVKSKAGGRVVKLFVEEGSLVKAGDKIALIDPEDTRTAYRQAAADVDTAKARVAQAQVNARMEERNAVDRVRDAEISLALAKAQYVKAQQSASAQPTLSRADLRSAQASLESAKESLRLYEEVQVPQTRRDSEGQYNRALADLEGARSEMARLQRLLNLGYVSVSDVERQRSTLAAAEAAFKLADQRRSTLESELDSQLRTNKAKVHQAEEALAQSQANQNKTVISQKDLEVARQNVSGAEVALSQAKTARLNVSLRKSDITSAVASAVRSEVAMKNAQVQMDSTLVVAPRDGVVTTKYLEEGTIIPPGTSTFAQGTSLVQIADTTQMEVECAVDEADIASVTVGQDVRIVVEAYPGVSFEGKVKRVFPAADTAQSVTTIKVRVSVGRPTFSGGGRQGGQARMGQGGQSPQGGQGLGQAAPRGQGQSGQGSGSPSGGQFGGRGPVGGSEPGSGSGAGQRRRGRFTLRPGMNATCEFIQLSKKGTLGVPQQAVMREEGKTYVRVKTSDPKKPEKREVKLGETGNETIEVLEGLKEGEEVVVAEIDLKAMRARQEKMQSQQQGNTGLGGLQRGGPSQSRASGGGTGGGGASRGGGR